MKIIQSNLSQEHFETWFQPVVPVSLKKQELTIQVPSMFYYEFIEKNFWKVLKTAVRHVMGPDGKLAYSVVMQDGKYGKDKKTLTLPHSSTEAGSNQPAMPPLSKSVNDDPHGREIVNPFVIPGLKSININSQLNSQLNFDNFIEGECNRLARAAGFAVAKNPGKTSFNPLFIHSEVGLGKTHLAHAIGLEIKANFPEKTVLYVDAETFLQQYLEAVKSQTINDFIHFYQMLDVLIIDDVQFLAKKEKTQEIFFHIFNFFQRENRQMVITSDKSPSSLAGFEQRLLSRFKWGLSADLQIPDKETRVRIIKSKLANSGITDIDEEVVDYLAYRIVTNVREIEGALISILAQSSLNRKTITVELAKQMIDKFVQNTIHEISIDYIQKVVCDYFNIPVYQMLSKSRKGEIVQVRHLSMYFAKKYTNLSLAQIGARSGDKDHATVLHACRAVENQQATNPKYAADLNNIDKILKNA
ncbi:MAG: chromosomal replication initiator protein DnaA [Bacteroidales bacterium]|nr:chromosomal replication initiator protein DnaA [Bacteroidales bacterium]